MSDVNINFFIVQKYDFFYLKLTLCYCEVVLISVKPIVNNKDFDELFCVFVPCFSLVFILFCNSYIIY